MAVIARKGVPAPIPAGSAARSGARTHAWTNHYGKLRRRTESGGEAVDSCPCLAAALVTPRMPVRRPRSRYRGMAVACRPGHPALCAVRGSACSATPSAASSCSRNSARRGSRYDRG
ncbi:hypothetical protein KNE206_43340 [Kitasatospora sp. NE20-6]